MEDRWLSVDEISVYLGVTKDTAYKWISEKNFRATKLGDFGSLRKMMWTNGLKPNPILRIDDNV